MLRLLGRWGIKMKDFLYNEIRVGDKVSFIYSKFAEKRALLIGEIVKVNPASVSINVPGDRVYRIMLSTSPAKDSGRMIKVVVLPSRKRRRGEIKDLTGYPIKVGDRVVCMQPSAYFFGESLMIGKVTSINGSRVMLDGYVESGISPFTHEPNLEEVKTYRSPDRLIVYPE